MEKKIFSKIYQLSLNLLTSLILNLDENKLICTRIGDLLKSISKLLALSNLELSMTNCSILSDGEENLY